MLEKSEEISETPSGASNFSYQIRTQAVQKIDRTIQGVVIDEEQIPIPGASILIKGTMNGVVTDIDGKFSLTIDDEDSAPILMISFIGFTTQEMPVGTTSTFTIELASSDLALN